MISRLFNVVIEGPGVIANVFSSAINLARVEGRILAKTFAIDLHWLTRALLCTAIMMTFLIVSSILFASSLIVGLLVLFPLLPLWGSTLLISMLFLCGSFIAWKSLLINLNKIGSSFLHFKELSSKISRGTDHESSLFEQQH